METLHEKQEREAKAKKYLERGNTPECSIYRLDQDALRIHAEVLEKEIAQLRVENPPTTATIDLPQMGHVKLAINSKAQLTGEVKYYSNDMMAAYIEAFKITSIIKAKNEKIE